MIKVSASIVTYRDYEKARNTIKSILDNTKGVDLSLYVVDNASGDNTGQRIKSEFPGVHFIQVEKNLGYGAGHNEVLPYIDSTYHAVINPDITLVGDALAGLAEMMENNPDIGIACPKILNPDMTEQHLPKRIPTVRYLMSGRVPFMKSVRDEFTRADEQLDEITDIDFITGCFMFMRTELLRKVGGFDTRYFMYIEDADLGREIKKYARSVYCPDVSVVHAWSRADKKNIKLLMAHFDSAFKYLHKWKKENEK